MRFAIPRTASLASGIKAGFFLIAPDAGLIFECRAGLIREVPFDVFESEVKGLKKVELKRSVTIQQITFYLRSCRFFRFPFFDPNNCYRRDGLFGLLEDVIQGIGTELSRRYGDAFISINMRGSWLRGIPIHGDDVDILFIVRELSIEQKREIEAFTRKTLIAANPLFLMCEGKTMMGVKVDPIIFLDMADIDRIMNGFLYGLERFIEQEARKDRDSYQDSFFGSKLTEKKTQFLKSGILIPYVGWLYGRERKREVFDEIGRYLPVPTRPARIYGEREIDEAKQTLRQAFIARNLIYPSLEIKKWIKLKNHNVEGIKREAMRLYRSLAPLDDIYARAVINYIYTLQIEEKFLGRMVTRERVRKFAPSYDKLVDDILTRAVIRLASLEPPSDGESC